MSSITNQIIANIKKTSRDFNSYSFVNSENVVCIDTSFNRIGINRKNPEYSIDISGTKSHNAVRSHDLYINNLANIYEISTNRIKSEIINVSNIDISDCTFNLLTGKTIDTSNLIFHNISSTKSNLTINNLSGEFLEIFDTISSENIITNNLRAKNIESITLILTQLDISNLKVDISANIENLINTNFSSDFLTCNNELSSNLLYVNKFFLLDESSFNQINVTGDASFTKLNVLQKAVFNEISTNSINVHTIQGTTIESQTFKSNGTIFMSDGDFGSDNNDINANFNTLNAKKIITNNIDISDNLVSKGVNDLSDGILILPNHKSNYDTDTSTPGTITLDKNNNQLKVFNHEWNNILFKTNFATFSLDKQISGNNILYNSNNQAFSIIDPDYLFLNLSDHPNFKYIPLKRNSKHGDKFDVSNNRTIEISNNSDGEIFEINATVSIKYLNKIPGDVEPNDFNFGIYPNIINNSDNNKVSIDNSYVTLDNTVIAFDNSYNLANTSLNYIGSLDNNSTLEDYDVNGFNFYISSIKDISYIAINKFYATIKQL